MSNRKELEERWYTCLADAKLRLDFAHQYMNEIERDYKAGTVPSSEGPDPYQKALRAETHALAEYRRVLRVYSALVLEGEIPDEAASAKG